MDRRSGRTLDPQPCREPVQATMVRWELDDQSTMQSVGSVHRRAAASEVLADAGEQLLDMPDGARVTVLMGDHEYTLTKERRCTAPLNSEATRRLADQETDCRLLVHPAGLVG